MHRTIIGERSFDIQVKDGKYQLNGHEGHLDLLEKQVGSFHCEIDGVSHEADLVKLDTENKQITLRIKGQKVLVQKSQSTKSTYAWPGVTNFGRTRASGQRWRTLTYLRSDENGKCI
jgi:hypothetical protein